MRNTYDHMFMPVHAYQCAVRTRRYLQHIQQSARVDDMGSTGFEAMIADRAGVRAPPQPFFFAPCNHLREDFALRKLSHTRHNFRTLWQSNIDRSHDPQHS